MRKHRDPSYFLHYFQLRVQGGKVIKLIKKNGSLTTYFADTAKKKK